MKVSLRGWVVIAALVAVAVGAVAVGVPMLSAAPPAQQGNTLNEESLGWLLASMGFEPKKTNQRYDFVFKAKLDGEEWELSMSSVLSKDGKSIWIMAWLDELPRTAEEVPRTALLRLLADNDKMGDGKFFAYVPSNRRFVLQQVIPNESITTSKFRWSVAKLGGSVMETYNHWAVANWNANPSGTQTVSGETPAKQPTAAGQPKTAAPEFNPNGRN